MRLHWSGLKPCAEEKSKSTVARNVVVEAILKKERRKEKAVAAIRRRC